MIYYMLKDYVGAASRILYAKQGDKVEIIRQDAGSSLLFVQAENGNKFHVFPDMLSTEPVPVAVSTEKTVVAIKKRSSSKRPSKK